MHSNLNPILEEELTSLEKLHWELGKVAEVPRRLSQKNKLIWFCLFCFVLFNPSFITVHAVYYQFLTRTRHIESMCISLYISLWEVIISLR